MTEDNVNEKWMAKQWLHLFIHFLFKRLMIVFNM